MSSESFAGSDSVVIDNAETAVACRGLDRGVGRRRRCATNQANRGRCGNGHRRGG